MVCCFLMLTLLTWKLKHNFVYLVQLRAWEGLSSQLWHIFVSLLPRKWGNQKGGNRNTHEITHCCTLVDICTVLSAGERAEWRGRRPLEARRKGQSQTKMDWPIELALPFPELTAAAFLAVCSEVLYKAWLQIAERLAFLPFPALTALPYCYKFSS